MVRGEREGEKEYQNQQQTNQMNNLVMFHSSRSGSSDTQQCHTIQYIKILCWSEKLVVLLFDSFFSDLVNLSFFVLISKSIFRALRFHIFPAEVTFICAIDGTKRTEQFFHQKRTKQKPFHIFSVDSVSWRLEWNVKQKVHKSQR